MCLPLAPFAVAGSCAAVCCSMLQRVTACCSVLQCVAVCCGVMQCDLQIMRSCSCVSTVGAIRCDRHLCCSVLQCVAVCCSVSQRVAVCCSVLQCVAAGCSVYLEMKRFCSCVSTVGAIRYHKLPFFGTATHCNTLQHTARTATHCNTLHSLSQAAFFRRASEKKSCT